MRRSVLAFTWVLGTTMSVVLAWWGVSVVGEQVATRRDTPFEEAIDIPPATTPSTAAAPTTAPPPLEPDPATADAITGFLDGQTSTTDTTAAPATTATTRPTRPTTVPATPATEAPPVEETATTAVPTTPSATTPPTAPSVPDPTTSTTLPDDRGITTTTPPPSGGASGPLPPGWDDRGGLAPKKAGSTTFTFDCGVITIHWVDYVADFITGELVTEEGPCAEQYAGAELEIRIISATCETELLITHPDGSTERYVIPAPPPRPEGTATGGAQGQQDQQGEQD